MQKKSPTSKHFFVVNPASAGGRGQKRWDALLVHIQSLFSDFDFALTRQSGDGTRLALDAIKQGYRSLIAVGGDGTLNEVVNAVFQARAAADSKFSVRVGVVPSGSGDDFRKTIGLPSDPEKTLRIIQHEKTLCIDVGLLEFSNPEGEVIQRHFINIADFGLGGSVMRKVNASPKFFGGKPTYLYHALTSFLLPELHSVEISTEEFTSVFDEVLLGVVANGRYFGGGLCIAPQAHLQNGLFEVMIVEKAGFTDLIKNLPRLYLGRRIIGRGIHHFQTKHLKVIPKSQHPIYLDVDGEQPGVLPCSFTILPRALDFYGV